MQQRSDRIFLRRARRSYARGLAASALLPDANFMPGSPAFPTSEPHRPNCAWNNGAEKRETGLF